jgi:predicted thioesterase
MNLLGKTAEATVPMLPATSRLVEVMELAAARLMRTRGGESSAAVSMKLHHAALSQARGAVLRARATCSAVDGRLYHFEVNVFDENGLVASGEHVRAVVSPRRIEAVARRRHAQPSMLLQV